MAWNRSDLIAMSALLVSIVAIIIGVIIPEVRCFVGLQSQSCVSPPKIKTTSPSPETTLISKATGVDYTQLGKLLEERKWKKADEETYQVMLQATGSKRRGWLRTEDIENFSCEDLGIIDQLWLKFSEGKFGFSVQTEIWQKLGEPIEHDPELEWRKFYIEVGWKQEGDENSWEGVDAGKDRGNFPQRWLYIGEASQGRVEANLFYRLTVCNL